MCSGRSARRWSGSWRRSASPCALFMMVFLPIDTWIRLGVWTLIGLAIYFVYSRPSRQAAALEAGMNSRGSRIDGGRILTQPDPVGGRANTSCTRSLGPVNLIMIGIGSIIGAGIFVITGHGGGRTCGPGGADLLRHRGLGLPVRRALLRRIRLDDPGIGQRLHLCLRHHGPLHGVVHRLEHGAGISGVGIDRGGGLVGLFRQLAAQFRHQLAGRLMQCAAWWERGLRRSAPDRRASSICRRSLLICWCWRSSWSWACARSANFNARHGADQDRHRDPGDRVRPCPIVHCEQSSRPSFRRIRARSDNSASAAFSPASGMIFFAYIGFEAVSVAAQEAKNPQRDCPSAYLGSLAICTVLYMLMARGADRHHRLAHAGRAQSGVVRGRQDRGTATGWCCRSISARLVGLASVIVRGALRPVAHLLFHGARRIPAAGCSQPCIRASARRIRAPSSPASSRRCWPRLPARHPGRPRFHRHAAGVRGGLRRHPDPARARRRARSGPSARPSSGSWRRRASCVCGLMMFSLSDDTWIRLVVWTALGIRHLFRLWRAACGTFQMEGVQRRADASAP